MCVFKNNMKKEVSGEKLFCSKCKSHFVYIRLKTKEKVCRKCGNIEKLEGKDGISS